MKDTLIKIIDTFYFIFKPFLPLKTYRYAVCGGSNVVLDTVLYFIVYHYVLHQNNVNLYFFEMKSHIATLFMVVPITFMNGFLMNKYITFQDSNLPTKTQFIRYFLVSCGAVILSYICMKLFVDLLGFYPTPSKIMSIFITVAYSYVLQNKFSFSVGK